MILKTIRDFALKKIQYSFPTLRLVAKLMFLFALCTTMPIILLLDSGVAPALVWGLWLKFGLALGVMTSMLFGSAFISWLLCKMTQGIPHLYARFMPINELLAEVLEHLASANSKLLNLRRLKKYALEMVYMLFIFSYSMLGLSILILTPILLVWSVFPKSSLIFSFLQTTRLIFAGVSNVYFLALIPIMLVLKTIRLASPEAKLWIDSFLRNYIETPYKIFDDHVNKIYSTLYNSVKQFCKYNWLKCKANLNIYFFGIKKENSVKRSNHHSDIVRYAVKHGHVSRLRWLQAHGVEIFYAQGDTIIIAIENKRSEMVRFLLEMAANQDPSYLERICESYLERVVLTYNTERITAFLNKMTDTQLEDKAARSSSVRNCLEVRQRRLNILKKDIFNGICPLVIDLYSSDLKGIVEPKLVQTLIMPMLPLRPDWCSSAEYEAVCADAYNKAIVISAKLEEKRKNASSGKSKETVLAPAAEPVIFSHGADEAANEVRLNVLPKEKQTSTPNIL